MIDCDVHPLIGDVGGLRQHMSHRAARRAFGEKVQVSRATPTASPIRPAGCGSTPGRRGAARPARMPPSAWNSGSNPYEIAAAVLIPIQSGLVIPWGDEAAGNEFISAFNRYFMEEWVGLDTRYRLCVSVSPYDMRAAVAEVERWADDVRVCGIFVPPGRCSFGSQHLRSAVRGGRALRPAARAASDGSRGEPVRRTRRRRRTAADVSGAPRAAAPARPVAAHQHDLRRARSNGSRS